ncbi:MAG TPA: protein kinase [Ktedonobacteraceae bacterium]|nr:protein kinase [Ktedonobacteraceae bacterium]
MTEYNGQRLGNYLVIRLVGQGGFGDVYLGEHIHLQTQVAIKVLQTRLVGSNLEQFRAEAQTIARLIHPHIVRILDFGVQDGTAFLVMDYAPHGTLRQRYPKGSQVPAAEAASYLKQVASALQYAHARKLIHRDIKPENMLLGASYEVLLSDFGLVLMAQSTSSQSTKELAGTVPYMAPEQINGKPRPASDQYALGIVAYEWLSGERPFQGSFVEIVTQHLVSPPPPLYGRVAGISPALEAVVLTALAKDPWQRFGSVEAFALAFEQACRTLPPDAPLRTRIVLPSDPAQQATIGENALSHPTVAQIPLTPPHDSTQQPTRGNAASETFPPTFVNTPRNATHQPQVFHTPSSPSLQSTPLNTPQNVSQQATAIHATSGQPPSSPGATAPLISKSEARGKPFNKTQGRWLVSALLLLLLFGGVSAGLVSFLPGILHGKPTPSPGSTSTLPGATLSALVTITPASKDIQTTYTISAVTGTPDPARHQVQARQVSYTTQPQARTVNTTGQGTTPATHATGMLTFTNAYPHASSYPAGSIYTDASGIQVVTDAQADIACCTPGANVTVRAHVVQTGPVGNIAANDINQPAEPGNHPTIVNNTNVFSGGQNAQTYTVVAQRDIDGAAATGKNSLTPTAQTGVQRQVRSNERLLGNPTCTPKVSSDHPVGDQVASITVTVTVTCTGEVYDHDGALALARTLLKEQASKNPGSDYALVGKIKTTEMQASLADARSGTIQVPLTVEGIWVFQFSQAQKSNLAVQLAGKSKTAALAFLAGQTGVSGEDIHVSGGDGKRLPTDAGQITITVQSVQAF